MTQELNLINRKWVVYGAAGYPAFISPFADVPARLYYKHYDQAVDGVALWTGENLDWLFDEKQLIKFSEKILPTLLSKQWKVYEGWRKEAKKFDKLHYKLYELNLSRISNEQLRDWIKNYYQAFSNQYFATEFIEPISYYFQQNLERLLSTVGIKSAKASSLISHFSMPAKPNYLKLCVAEYNQLKNKNKVKSLLAKYHYINSDYTGTRPFTRKNLEKLVANSNSRAIHTTEFTGINSKARSLLNVLQITATIQDVRKAQSLMWIAGAGKLLRELTKRKNLNFDILRYATWDEIISNTFDTSKLQARSKSCVIYWHKNGVSVYVGKEALGLFSDFKKSMIGTTEKITEFTGVSASSGKVKGKAVVV